MKRRSACTSCLLLAGLLLAAFPLAISASARQQSDPATPAQTQQSAPASVPQNGGSLGSSTLPDGNSAAAQVSGHPLPGTISGIIGDPTGVPVVGAKILLSTMEQPVPQEILSGENGEFILASVPPGSYRLTISAPGFTPQTLTGMVQPGEEHSIPRITLAVAPLVTEVRVSPATQAALAEAEIKEQEKQRVLGVLPNFYVTYDPSALPLTSKQKFELAWKTTIDPVTFGIVGGVAGFQQAEGYFNGYGQGAQGYAKRYGASYADTAIGVMLGGAVLPSLLKQDPRYFYKGTGSKRSRVLYAMANAVICKGDNGRWQPNYSSIIGSLAAGGISNLYYSPQDRDGLELTFENTLIGIGENAGENILQEFVIRKLTPKKNLDDEPLQH
jgi:hypothetical protein